MPARSTSIRSGCEFVPIKNNTASGYRLRNTSATASKGVIVPPVPPPTNAIFIPQLYPNLDKMQADYDRRDAALVCLEMFTSTPTAKSDDTTAVLPWLINGSGMPVSGTMPTMAAILKKA